MSSSTTPQVTINYANFLLFEALQATHLLIFSPAMGVRAAHYSGWAQSLTKHGFTVIINELRGNGLSPVRASRSADFGYAELINEDLHDIVAYAAEHYPALPLILGGHSLGGQVAALYTAKYKAQVAGLLLIAVSSPYYRGFSAPQSNQIRFSSYLFQASAAVLGYFPGKHFGLGRREARTLINDWSKVARHNLFAPKGDTFNYEAALAHIECPILTICFARDVFAPLTAVRQLTQKFPQEQLTLMHIDEPELAHVNHFNWVKESSFLAAAIQRWLTPSDDI